MMDIANNVKRRVRTKKTPLERDSPPLKEGKSKPKLSRSTPTLFKRQVKAGNVPGIQKKTARNIKNIKAGKLSVLSLINKKRKNAKVSDEDSSDSPTKPAFYRTRNAATIAYLDSLQVVRRTLAPKKLIKPSNKKNSREQDSEEFPAITPKREVIPASRVLSNGLWFTVGDIISVYGDEEAKGRLYYAQIRAFLKDQFCEQYVAVRWFLPASKKRRQGLPFSFSPFDLNNFLEGPEHDEPLNMNNINFVAHAPRASVTYKPGNISHQVDNPYSRQYRDREGLKILDVPTPTATSSTRHPFI